jgi:hypothetical protein
MFRINKKNSALDLDLAVLHRLHPDRFDRPQGQVLGMSQHSHGQKGREDLQHTTPVAQKSNAGKWPNG